MMKYLRTTILLVFILITIMSLGVVVLAQDMLSSDVVLRPQVTYRSAQLRDPFVSVLTNEAKPANQGLAMEKPKIDPNKFKVQGLIWGSKLPQTIINGTVLRIGDFIEEAEVLEIDKKGVVLSISGQIVNLSAPGQSGIIKDKTKEE